MVRQEAHVQMITKYAMRMELVPVRVITVMNIKIMYGIITKNTVLWNS